jgi:hypothetical protein
MDSRLWGTNRWSTESDSDGYSSGNGAGYGYCNGSGDLEGNGRGNDSPGLLLNIIGVPHKYYSWFDGTLGDASNLLLADSFAKATTTEEQESILGILELMKEGRKS